ncbi:tRNA lysidine(34) synthetase TilS [Cohnella endophytica]|uniref:tRNA lysidine(34) synthetase TilS n=1 Tax=Cohnella endophytica TaxID=2419778 RepID=UPI0013142880|nr:tRNA lysidine(34) synthetase TilS [Cohnella endophytica]
MQPQEEWKLRIMEQARTDGWWREGSAVVAAVSGGPDSMALLHLLRAMAEETPFRIVVAHANHQFRGAESDAEAELVAGAARDWGLAFESTELGMPAYIAETGMNPQSASREKRYIFLKNIALKHGCSYLITGHHADDQAETVLMRIIRGTGIGGLAGIPSHRKEDELELIRPLLRITKCELLEYCKRNGVPYAVDSSNADRHYFRNAVRMDLMPMLEQHNPRLKTSLIRLADMAAAEDDYMETETLQAFQTGVTPSGEGFRLERRWFRGLHVALQRRLIKLILNCSSNPRQMLDFPQVEEILTAIAQERPTVVQLDIGDGWVFRREYEEGYIGPAIPESIHFAYDVTESLYEVTIKETGDRVRLERLDGAVSSAKADRQEACFDFGQLKFPLRIRSRLPGDLMQPYGLNGTKKVQDMFVDAKVPRSLRDKLPLLADRDGRVLWIPGMRRSSHALVTDRTITTLRITLDATEN